MRAQRGQGEAEEVRVKDLRQMAWTTTIFKYLSLLVISLFMVITSCEDVLEPKIYSDLTAENFFRSI